MSEPFVGEIRIFPYSFPPRLWADCDGQMLPVSQNPTLFSVIGTTYGGDGRTTFALPNLQGCVPMHPGQGPGLSPYRLGWRGGLSHQPIGERELPHHQHKTTFYKQLATTSDPFGNYMATDASPTVSIWAEDDGHSYTAMAPSSLMQTGGDQAHENRQPFLTLRFCIALEGVYPTRP